MLIRDPSLRAPVTDAPRVDSDDSPAGRVEGDAAAATPADAVAGRGFLDEDSTATLARLRLLSHYLDDLVRIPGTNYRIGLDPLLGLLPVVGDAPTTVLSAYIVAEAAAFGVPRATLARMVSVLVVDAVVGSIPVVGDAFDAVWKANDRNVRLLERRARAGDVDADALQADRRFVLGVAVVLVAALIGVAAAATVAVWWLLGQVGAV